MVFTYVVTLTGMYLRSRFISSRIYGYKFGWCSSSRTNPPSQFPTEQLWRRVCSFLESPFSFLSLASWKGGREAPGTRFCGTLETVYSKASDIAPTIRASKLLTSRNGPVIARQSLSGIYEFFTPPSVTSFCHFRCVTFTDLLQSCWPKSMMV